VHVDGSTAHLGDRVDPATANVSIDGVRVPLNPDLITWLIYKPTGMVSTMDDPQGRPMVTDLVPSKPVTKPVGRLDLHSEGLMLLTNDGDLALYVTHPRYGIEKTYQALTLERVTAHHCRTLTEGIELEDGTAKAKTARIVTAHGGRSLVEIVMTEGRKREIRRMFDALDLTVERLVRVSIGGISDRTLTSGTYRALTPEEARSIYSLAAGSA
jgi:23S rRNA pseudouridine2605 synthase